MDSADLKKYLAFIEKAENLKNTIRLSRTSKARPESAAEHSWRLALMALVFEDEFAGLDSHKILKLCILHDLGEAIGGDIPAPLQKNGGDKSAGERRDFLELAGDLDEAARGRLAALWDEYENVGSPEAVVVKGLDKLETLIQHNQGDKSEKIIDYEFNLDYGRRYTDAHPLLKELRRLIDPVTAKNAGR
ncbi:HD domain-containing protein [Deltaproteobacteria bacterium OttesenSCG-928-K17]|nr:HD domain-containing protein [Deltaproteobacteria bacterium OttesenSCG-928-K17]